MRVYIYIYIYIYIYTYKGHLRAHEGVEPFRAHRRGQPPAPEALMTIIPKIIPLWDYLNYI